MSLDTRQQLQSEQIEAQTQPEKKAIHQVTDEGSPLSSSSSTSSNSAISSNSTANTEDHYIDYHFETPRFSVHDESAIEHALAYLEEHGYVVFSDVATHEETEQAHQLFWEFQSTTFPGRKISQHNVDSWDELPIMQTGVTWQGGIGNSAFAWHVRSLPTIKRIFSAVWNGEENLVASMDGAGVFRPTITGTGAKRRFREDWITKGAWFHVDQSPTAKPAKECVQGLFSVFDQDETTGGLVVVPGSHHHFNSLASLVKTNSTHDFVPIPEGHFLLDRTCGAARPRLVKCAAGDFILWDSRLIHCNSPALRDQLYLAKHEQLGGKHKADRGALTQVVNDLLASQPSILTSSKPMPPRLQRLVSYQCMTPTSKINPKSYQQYKESRLEAVEKGMTTNHWPHQFTGGQGVLSTERFTPVKLNAYRRELVVGQ